MVGQELAQDLVGLGGEEGGPLQPPGPLCPPFLLSNEGESKWQTRIRILAHEARGRRPRRQGQGEAEFRACARNREEKAARQKGKRQQGAQESP